MQVSSPEFFWIWGIRLVTYWTNHNHIPFPRLSQPGNYIAASSVWTEICHVGEMLLQTNNFLASPKTISNELLIWTRISTLDCTAPRTTTTINDVDSVSWHRYWYWGIDRHCQTLTSRLLYWQINCSTLSADTAYLRHLNSSLDKARLTLKHWIQGRVRIWFGSLQHMAVRSCVHPTASPTKGTGLRTIWVWSPPQT